MHPSPAPSFSPHDAIRIACRHQKKFWGFFLGVFALVALATFLAPKVYRSESKLFVRLGRENVGLDATATLGDAPSVAIPYSREDEINSVVELLKSRELSEQVVAELGPAAILGPQRTSWLGFVVRELGAFAGAVDSKPQAAPSTVENSDAGAPPALTPRDRAIREFESHRGVAAVKKTNIISLSYDARNPEVARKILSCLVNKYLAQHIKINRTAGAHEFLVGQTATLRTQLTAVEDQLRDLKQRTGVAAPQEQQQILVARIGRLEDELLQTESQLAATLAEARRLSDSLEGVDRLSVIGRTSGLENAAADDVRNQLYRLQLQEQELLAKFTEQHPEVEQVRRAIAGVQTILGRKETPRPAGPDAIPDDEALLRDEPVLSSLRAKAERLTGQLTAARAELEQFNDHQLQIARLEREVGLQEGNYRQSVDSLNQAALDQNLQSERISNINVVEAATYEPKPLSPNKLLNLIAGLGLGFVGGVALVLASEYLDQSVRTPDEVETRLGLPMLATIPRLPTEQLILSRSK